MKQIINAAFCVLFVVASACHNEPQSSRRAFYHWKTRLSLAEAQRAYLDRLGVDKIYVKFFDVDWDEAYAGPVPLAEVEIDTQRLQGLEVVPCVFITNRTIAQMPDAAVPELVDRILRKTEELTLQYPGMHIREWQVDCDWTASTRDRYFALLELLREKLKPRGVILSATVRLHQYQRPEQTGVPPVDRGMLMCYNTGDLESWEEENSILSKKDVGLYVQSAGPYPLPLDVALPVFSWGVLFRNGRMIRLIHGMWPEHLADTGRFRPISPYRFKVVKSTYFQGHYLYEGDLLRIEAPTIYDLEGSADMMRRVLRHSDKRADAAFYHLDSAVVRRFPAEKLSAIWHMLDR